MKKLFCQHPYQLEHDERLQLLDRRFPDSGHGMFWKIYHRIKLGNGSYALSALQTELGTDGKRRKRLQSVLNDFRLFIIENGMVQLSTGLTISDLRPKTERKVTNKEKLQKLQQQLDRGYSGTLLPEDLRRMDEQALQQVQADIQARNQQELNATAVSCD